MSEAEKMDGIPIDTAESPTVVLELIHQLKVKDVMTTAVITGKKDHPMHHIQALMRENKVSSIPIVEISWKQHQT